MHISANVTKCDTIIDINAFIRNFMDDRKGHHGWEHAHRVCNNALRYAEIDKFNFSASDMVIFNAASRGHDAYDSKIDKDGTLRTKFQEGIINILGHELAEHVFLIIDNISVSKEAGPEYKNVKSDEEWIQIFGNNDNGRRLLQMRHYISDADKIEATGKIGHIRAVEYNEDILKQKGCYTFDACVHSVKWIHEIKHYQMEKWLHCEAAKVECRKNTVEMVEAFEKWAYGKK